MGSILKAALVVLLVSTVLLTARMEAAAASCNNTKTLSEVEECRAAVESKSGSGKPSAACCSKLKAVGRTCLCALLQDDPPAGIDLTKAAKLPIQCGIPGPDTC